MNMTAEKRNTQDEAIAVGGDPEALLGEGPRSLDDWGLVFDCRGIRARTCAILYYQEH
jgi:hypothetical protein